MERQDPCEWSPSLPRSRRIAPQAIGSDGFRWHVRACCQESGQLPLILGCEQIHSPLWLAARSCRTRSSGWALARKAGSGLPSNSMSSRSMQERSIQIYRPDADKEQPGRIGSVDTGQTVLEAILAQQVVFGMK